MTRLGTWILVGAALAGCGGGGSSRPPVDDGGNVLTPDGAVTGDGQVIVDVDAGPDASIAGLMGTLSGDFRTDHIGWRPGDRKLAVLLGHAGASVEVRRAGDGSVAGTYTSSALTTEPDSSDMVSTVDFSALTTPGTYYLYLPGGALRSYPFSIAADSYDLVGRAAMKSFYFQRCNHDKVMPHASDVLPGAAGLGGRWTDGSCHGTDTSAPPGPGSAQNGNLDVHGGWHDAGDYQKTLWGRGVPELLFAYEVNPTAWADGRLALPESGNGIPDLLDEVRWELDFYVRMQRPDGHFMSSVKGRDPTVVSPPSASNESRVYFDTTSPDGNGWSGGGVTIASATANATSALAHAAVVFRAAGQTAIGNGYAAAAAAGWGWLATRTPTDAGERRQRLAAAAAVYRMDPTVATARTVVEGFAWSTWDGMLPGSVTPGESTVSTGAWHVLSNAAATTPLKNTIKTAVQAAIVDRAFSEPGLYGPLYGGPGNGWDWSWGSNRAQGFYGANLLMALRFDVRGSHSAAEVAARAQQHLHYLLGMNPLSMLYFTNMAAYGGEHSSFQIYHSWWSYTGSDGDHGNAMYNGKPMSVVEPMYPYHPMDTQTSTYGPPPGLVPGGPNFYYSASYDMPNKNRPPYAYRDFSVGCDWSGSVCRAASWEITEPMDAYQGPVVWLLSFHMPQ